MLGGPTSGIPRALVSTQALRLASLRGVRLHGKLSKDGWKVSPKSFRPSTIVESQGASFEGRFFLKISRLSTTEGITESTTESTPLVESS